jgi:hypothetical protein
MRAYHLHPIRDRAKIKRWLPKLYAGYCRRHGLPYVDWWLGRTDWRAMYVTGDGFDQAVSQPIQPAARSDSKIAERQPALLGTRSFSLPDGHPVPRSKPIRDSFAFPPKAAAHAPSGAETLAKLSKKGSTLEKLRALGNVIKPGGQPAMEISK